MNVLRMLMMNVNIDEDQISNILLSLLFLLHRKLKPKTYCQLLSIRAHALFVVEDVKHLGIAFDVFINREVFLYTHKNTGHPLAVDLVHPHPCFGLSWVGMALPSVALFLKSLVPMFTATASICFLLGIIRPQFRNKSSSMFVFSV